ncbi:MAG TPA: Ig-like domain-containing protein, partial [Bacteroidota bacterium]|nr:Ig-like domain-containing protein [Bacteroidota bacterium]
MRFVRIPLIAPSVSGKTLLHCIWIAGILLLAGCAGQLAPSGGPPDTTPPVVTLSTPAARTLHFQDHTISLSFSKYVDRRSVQESIFFSPSLGSLTYEWGSMDVDIHFNDSLRANTTYVMTLGTDVVDTRGNRMAHAYFLPFSTGEKIDSARISGVVYDANPEGVMIFCYQLNSRIPDTLNPHETKPDYLSQTGKDGSFALPYLAYGTYRIYAIRDQYKNLLYDPQTDQFGTFSRDITLTPDHPVFTGAQFRLTVEDTTPPFLSSAREIDRNHILLKFSEAIDPASVIAD